METMYHEMETEIYEKFNVEMRRLVLKYRETEKILKKVNEKINSNIDYWVCDKENQTVVKRLEAEIKKLKE